MKTFKLTVGIHQFLITFSSIFIRFFISLTRLSNKWIYFFPITNNNIHLCQDERTKTIKRVLTNFRSSSCIVYPCHNIVNIRELLCKTFWNPQNWYIQLIKTIIKLYNFTLAKNILSYNLNIEI